MVKISAYLFNRLTVQMFLLKFRSRIKYAYSSLLCILSRKHIYYLQYAIVCTAGVPKSHTWYTRKIHWASFVTTNQFSSCPSSSQKVHTFLILISLAGHRLRPCWLYSVELNAGQNSRWTRATTSINIGFIVLLIYVSIILLFVIWNNSWWINESKIKS